MPPEAQLQCYCKRGNPVNPDRQAGRVAHPYKLLCSITAGGTAAVLPQIRHSGANRKKTASLCFFNAILTRFGTHFVILYSG